MEHRGLAVSNRKAQPAGCEESWITKTSDFRTAVPVMVSSIGTFGGAVAVPPAVALVAPAGVSRHCSPEIMYQPSGPGWTWTMDRSVGTHHGVAKNHGVQLPLESSIGPTTATACPPSRARSRGPNSQSHTRPSSSTTIPVALLAASAAARFGNVRRCQYTVGSENRNPLSVARQKKPNSGLFCPGGMFTHPPLPRRC